MAQCKQNPQEFIKNAFTPQIAVMCTPSAEKCCQKNNLTFVELIQPFSRLTNDVNYTDPSGTNITIRNMKLTFLDINWKPPQTSLARKLLNSSVSNAPESRNKIFQVGKYSLEVPTSTLWFEAWREIFLKVQYPSDHEFTKHFLACVLVISSSDSDPTQTFFQLEQSFSQMQNITPGKLPKWFNSNVLKYYVIVHDNLEGDSTSLVEAFEASKRTYGNQNCFLLKVNSRSSTFLSSEPLADPWSQFVSTESFMTESKSSPDLDIPRNSLELGREAQEPKSLMSDHPLSPISEDLSSGDFIAEEDILKEPIKPKVHGICLSPDDLEQVKQMVYEFSKSCLLPYIERQISLLNDGISNKKGVSKSLFSATKRWFSPNKPGSGSLVVNNLIYSPDSQELQVRRLGDLYFMFGHYSAAFQAYHLAKRDYNTDQAWLYYAGALEMAALSAFMANEPTRKTSDYMEESITTYLNTCKMPQFATRATILSAECLKHQNLYGEAAHQLIRMTSEESDLRSALLLEQASYCFLQSKMARKYAFHMVLAGHRFSKAAQKKHSLKCYKQAYQIYWDTRWDLACDHIHYTIGKQANNLQLFDEAVDSFSRLLKGESKQSAIQQAMFLKEYLMVLTNKRKTEDEAETSTIPILPIPDFEIDSFKILVEPTRPLSTPGQIPAAGITFNSFKDMTTESKWIKLEEMLIQETEGSLPVIFKPLVTLYNVNNIEKGMPIAVVNEPIQVSIKLVNTLQTMLNLKDVYLLWSFEDGSKVISNEMLDENKDDFVKTHITKCLNIEGNSKQDLILALTPLMIGQITLNGFCYTLTGSNAASETSFIKGKQNIFIPDNTKSGEDAVKKHVQIKVVPSAPCLQVTFSEMNLDFLSDELQKVSIVFQNTSTVPLQNICMATSVPHLLSSCEFRNPDEETTVDLGELSAPAVREKYMRKNHITSVPLPGNVLEPGQSATVYLWVKAASVKGPAAIDLLIYYENVIRTNVPRYRLIRHSWNLTVQESISIDVSTQASHNSKTVEEIALAMKITNLNKVHSSVSTEIMLLNVGLLSKNWTLTEDIVTPKYINLNSQESAHILLKAKRTAKNNSEYSNILLNSDRKSVQGLKNTYLAFARNVEKPLLNAFDDNLENLSFKENKDGILLVQWQAVVIDANKKRTVNGQCHVPIEVNRKEEDIIQLEKILSDNVIDISEQTLAEEAIAQTAQNQVSCNLVYPPVIHHNFLKQNLCIVPVKLLLHSIVDHSSLSIAINTIKYVVTPPPPSINKPNLFCNYASSNFCWLGNCKILKTLPPLKSTSAQLMIAISGPGTFDLGAHIEEILRAVQWDLNRSYMECKRETDAEELQKQRVIIAKTSWQQIKDLMRRIFRNEKIIESFRGWPC